MSMKPVSTEPKGNCPALADGLQARLECVPLNKISGVHTSLEHMCGIYSAQKVIFEQACQRNARRTSILESLVVLKSGAKYICISDPSTYVALSQIYSPESEVMCIVIEAIGNKSDIDKHLRENSEIQTVLAIARVAHRSQRKRMGRLIDNLSDPAKCLLGRGRKTLRAICKNLKLSPNTFKVRGKAASGADAEEHDHDLKTPVDQSKEEWSAPSE